MAITDMEMAPFAGLPADNLRLRVEQAMDREVELFDGVNVNRLLADLAMDGIDRSMSGGILYDRLALGRYAVDGQNGLHAQAQNHL
jgi:hypothetical protein